MLTHYLQVALKSLGDLIEATRNDIDDIKQARHANIFERAKIKEQLVKSFENHKSLIDNEIAKLASANPEAELASLLKPEEREMLSRLREELEELKRQNTQFAKMVIGVSEFYNSLLNKIMPTEKVGYGAPKGGAPGYGSQQVKSASILQVRG